MTIRVPVDAVIEALDDGDRWIQGSWENDDDGGLCMHGGIRACQVIPGDAHIIEWVAAVQGWGTGFNDADDTTWPMVRAALVAHREVTPPELEAVYGPQWKIIVRVVRQAATLTPDQTAVVHSARDAAGAAVGAAAWDAARAAARDAARVAARDAAGDAAGDAAWVAAGDAAWVAAGDAARVAVGDAAWVAAGVAARVAVGAAAQAAGAVAVRDLISSDGFTQTHYDGFTQTHYDLLTAPWRAAFPGFDEVAA